MCVAIIWSSELDLLTQCSINNFKKLSTLTYNVSLDVLEDTISMQDHVTLLCFLGDNIEAKKGGVFNLNQKIYKEFYGYRPFQIIAIYPEASVTDVEKLSSDLGTFTDMYKWNFISMDRETISELHANLKTKDILNTSLYSKKVYLIQGVVEKIQKTTKENQLTIVNFMLTKQLEHTLNLSKMVIIKIEISVCNLAILTKYPNVRVFYRSETALFF